MNTGADHGRSEQEHPGDDSWTFDGMRFRCVVDNQALAQIVNGTQALADETVRPIFERIHTNVRNLLDLGLKPAKDWLPPVEWRPRRFNTRSDAICNLILDGLDAVDYRGENADVVIQLRPHYLLFSDGGCRNAGRSATGYVIYGMIYGTFFGSIVRNFNLNLCMLVQNYSIYTYFCINMH